MPLYEARIIIRESKTQWRFSAPDLEEARVRLDEKVDELIDVVLTTAVYEVKELTTEEHQKQDNDGKMNRCFYCGKHFQPGESVTSDEFENICHVECADPKLEK
jgi:hypothetical protein